jgi:hypothetical protein
MWDHDPPKEEKKSKTKRRETWLCLNIQLLLSSLDLLLTPKKSEQHCCPGVFSPLKEKTKILGLQGADNDNDEDMEGN